MNNINATSTQNSKDGIKVEVFVPEKKPKKKKKKAPKEPPQPVNKNAFLDLLFSFIGVSSQSNELKTVQRDTLNLFKLYKETTRPTAVVPAEGED